MPNGQQVINTINYLANNYADGDAEMVELIFDEIGGVSLYVYNNETIQFTREDEFFFASQGIHGVFSADETAEEEADRYSRVSVLYN